MKNINVKELINNLNQQIEADYRNNEVDDKTYQMEIEIEALLKKHNFQLSNFGLVIN